ncbi:hypothetical protein, partial [Helicobacter sp. T3_23-1059]
RSQFWGVSFLELKRVNLAKIFVIKSKKKDKKMGEKYFTKKAWRKQIQRDYYLDKKQAKKKLKFLMNFCDFDCLRCACRDTAYCPHNEISPRGWKMLGIGFVCVLVVFVLAVWLG